MKGIILFILIIASNVSFCQFRQPVVIDDDDLEHIKNIKIIDLNNDNQKDIIVSYSNNSIIWYKNENLNFTEMPAITNSMNKPVYIDYADIDGNGLEDLLVSNSADLSKIHVFKNMSDGTNWEETIIDENIPAGISRSMFADLDNDGDLDIISAHEIDVSIYLNTDGVFSNQISVANNSEYYNLVVKDYNNDGFVDFFVNSAFGLQLYTNNQDLTFTSQIITNELHALLETHDIDNDGDFDVFYRDNSQSGNIKTLKNDGVGNFSLFQSNNFNVGVVQNPSFKFINLDADTFSEVIYTPISPQEIRYRTNDGNGNLSTPNLIDSTYEYSYVTGGDLDNDSDNDIVWYAHSNFDTKRLGIIENELITLNLQDEESPRFKFFPNPVKDVLTITNLQNSKNLTIKILDIQGRLVYKNNEVPKFIVTTNWSDGLYLVQIDNTIFKVLKSSK
ncbi:hypothetical protein LPB136_09240 [Tenacibaculum todarodis]|uniref:Secretion system C-terminal sorting domain-containing protein n=1 Tax=Tenacibaculum todarodis TaxID=1850252 RepID=A0A1L3JK84_9FLAO|nr:FG-GAP-like repeat-containing protein [Tenacibaculum todarodis]APG65531.1 hypothetical protein LPB136_09240 [Tenacibaculum todarodis]